VAAAISAFVAVATAVAGALVFAPHAKLVFNGTKAWELTTQFFFVAVLGSAVAFAYRRWEAKRAEDKQRLDEERERRAVQRASLEEFYRSTIAVHNEYKKIRRTLRAAAVHDEHGLRIERGKFEQLMDRLEDCQLRTESLRRDVKAQQELFGGEQKKLDAHLRTIGNHLRKILRYYEDGYGQRRQIEEKALMPIDDTVKEFIEHRSGDDEAPSNANLFDPADELRGLVLKLIAERTPASRELR
jgi:hypothetical protein